MGAAHLFTVHEEDLINIRKIAHNLHERLGVEQERKARLLLVNAVKMNAIVVMNIIQYSDGDVELFNASTAGFKQEKLIKECGKQYLLFNNYTAVNFNELEGIVFNYIVTALDSELTQLLNDVVGIMACGVML